MLFFAGIGGDSYIIKVYNLYLVMLDQLDGKCID